MSTIADRIKEICAQKGTSMYKLEKQLNLGNGTIGKCGKNGRQPTYDKAVAVASALGVSADYLLTGEQKKKSPLPKKQAFTRRWRKVGGFCKSPAFFDYLPHFIKVCLYIC